IFFLEPFPYRSRILFVRSAHRLLRGQTPGSQVASHRPHRNLQSEFSRQQLLHCFPGPQRKGQAQLVRATAQNMAHRRGCLMGCQARNRRPSAPSCFQRPPPCTLHQPHPAAHRPSRYPENPCRLGLRKTFLDGLDNAPAKVFLGFSRQRASILFFHAHTLSHYLFTVIYIMLRLVTMRAARRFSCPSFFHPSTKRRMYKLLSNGLSGAPCGVPRPSSRLRVLRRLFPFSSVSSTGASSHILIRCRIAPSTIRRATDFKSSACGIESK